MIEDSYVFLTATEVKSLSDSLHESGHDGTDIITNSIVAVDKTCISAVARLEPFLTRSSD
jgi:hypothetical protein